MKLTGGSEGRAQREIYSYKQLHQKRKITQFNNLILYLEELETEEHTKPKTSRWKEIINVTVEKNKMENRKIMGSTKSKVSSLKRSTKLTKL